MDSVNNNDSHTVFDISSVKNRITVPKTESAPTGIGNGWIDPGCGIGAGSGESAMGSAANSKPKIVYGTAGYVLEDVPHLTDFIPNLPVRRRFLLSLYYAFLLR